MFSYITGELVDFSQDFIIIDHQGIGYRIFVSQKVIQQLPSKGSFIKIHTHFIVREDAMTLYGFLSKDELEMFGLLLGVNGVGPKAGISILSTLTPDELRFAIISAQPKAISAAPGIGSKTAQRIILDLKDKIDGLEAVEQSLSAANTAPLEDLNHIRNEAILALTSLGYSTSEVVMAMQKIQINEDVAVEELIKLLLKELSFS